MDSELDKNKRFYIDFAFFRIKTVTVCNSEQLADDFLSAAAENSGFPRGGAPTQRKGRRSIIWQILAKNHWRILGGARDSPPSPAQFFHFHAIFGTNLFK